MSLGRCGYPVEQGPVAYIAAEGSHSVKNRVAAWMSGCGKEEEKLLHASFKLIGEAVQLVDGGLTELLDALASLGPQTLVVIDTFARCAVGLDENSAKEMGMFIGACDVIREETGAAVLLVHHSAKGNTTLERGSSALRGAAEAMLLIEKNNSTLTVKCQKQKDNIEFDPLVLRLEQVDLGLNARAERVSSCRVVPVGATADQADESESRDAKGVILEVLRTEDFESGVDGPTLLAATSLTKSRFYEHLKALIAMGEVEKLEGNKCSTYRLKRPEGTEGQSKSQSTSVPPSPGGTDPPSPSPSPTAPLKGGGVDRDSGDATETGTGPEAGDVPPRSREDHSSSRSASGGDRHV